MRIPVKRVDLGTLGYESYWVEVPRSVTEGWLYEMQSIASSEKPDGEKIRDTNLMVLEAITAWNIDDEDGKIFPLFSAIKTREGRVKILAQIPVDIILHLSQVITGGLSIPEGTKDF